jgi:hypothetical protein
MAKIKFLVNPTGQYGLAYFKDDEAEVADALASVIVEDGNAEYVGEDGEPTAPKVVSKKKAEKV